MQGIREDLILDFKEPKETVNQTLQNLEERDPLSGWGFVGRQGFESFLSIEKDMACVGSLGF